MIECGSVSSLAGGPWAITVPPLAPAPGPISMTQSAARMISRSCSTTTTELPFPASAVSVLRSPATLAGCSPTDGSSSSRRPPEFHGSTAPCSIVLSWSGTRVATSTSDRTPRPWQAGHAP